ncbi:MAG: ABC transporter substrate-binding protein [Opitutales bacterium]
MKLRRYFLIYLLLSVLPAGLASASTPETPVERLHTSLIEAMKSGDSQTYLERYDALSPAVNEAHHFALIARVVLGSHWSQLESPQKAQFVRQLTDLAVSNYADEFNAHQGEAFVPQEGRELKRGQRLVRAVLERPGKDAVRFDYVVALDRQGNWGIINVIVDGVSDLAVKRAEYQQVIDDDGFEALIARMEAQIAERGGRGSTSG